METNNPVSGQPSKCKCGAVIEPVKAGVLTAIPTECRDCDAKTQQTRREDAERTKAYTAAALAVKKEARYNAVIPRLYRDAQIGHLAPALQTTLMDLDETRGVYLWGSVGSGKTYALAALCKQFLDTGIWVKRVVWGRLLFRIRQTFSGHDSEMEIVSPLLSAPKLVIEDIGTAASMNKQESDFAVKTLLMILDSRIEDCLPVFVTSNLSLENLSQTFDARIASRIQQACEVIELKGKDRRGDD